MNFSNVQQTPSYFRNELSDDMYNKDLCVRGWALECF